MSIVVRRKLYGPLAVAAGMGLALLLLIAHARAVSSTQLLSAAFQLNVLKPRPEAPFELRFFTGPVKTDSQGRIITGPTSDPVKNVVGAEAAGERGGLQRFTKIMFGVNYFDGRPNPGSRINPNNPVVGSGDEYWPFRAQPFRSWPNALAITPDGNKVYVTLPGREGYPDWRVAVVDAARHTVLKWVDLRPAGQTLGTRPVGVRAISVAGRTFVVVLNEFANFATVLDAATDGVVGYFETGFYAEDLVYDERTQRLYVTDRFNDQVRVFQVAAGPFFTRVAEIPTGTSDLERSNPRNLALSADGRVLYVANTLGHTIAAIDTASNTLITNLPLGGLATDVKIAGRWGIVSGHATNTVLNGPETGHGLPKKDASGNAIRNNGQPLGYVPVMTDATKATTFDDIGSEINVFDTATNRFVYRYVDAGRDDSMLVVPGKIVDLQDHAPGQKIIRGSGPEQMFVRGNLLFVSMLHSDKVEVFRIDQNPADVSRILTPLGFEYTGGITPQGIVASPDGSTIFVANMQTEDISFLRVNADGSLTRQGYLAVGVAPSTLDPTTGGRGKNLFATDEEVGLRWLFTSSYADDGQKSCGNCHWQSRHDGSQWNVGANALGGVKAVPQNKDLSDNWPEWFEGLNTDMTAYASACNGELIQAEKQTALFPQPNLTDRLKARDDYVKQATARNSSAIGRPELSGKAFSVGYYDMAFLQILWTQNEVRRLPNPLAQFPTSQQSSVVARGRYLFTTKVASGGAGCADCHHNGNKISNGVIDDTFQDYNIHEPGVVSETTVDGNGPFFRPENDYFFKAFGPPQDEGSRQNVSSRNTKHLRTFWDGVPRWLHHGGAHTLREILLAPDSPLLRPGERGFNFRTVRTDHQRAVAKDFLGKPPVVLPTEVPITFADRSGALAGDGMGPLLVSLDSPTATQADGAPVIDRVGTGNLAPLLVNGQINPALAANHIAVVKDTHGKTSHLGAADIDALAAYLMSLE